MHNNRTLVPPDMVALLLNSKAGPKIIGWTFQLNNGVYYANNRNGNDYITMWRNHATVYDMSDVCRCSRNEWGWGRKEHGTWRAVYEQPTINIR